MIDQNDNNDGGMVSSSTASLTRTTDELNKQFGMASSELTISFLRCIADEAMGLIN